MLVKRWFLKIANGEVADGPFREKKEAQKEAVLYFKHYHVVPDIALEGVDTALKYAQQVEEFYAGSVPDGRKVGGDPPDPDHAVEQITVADDQAVR
jgi:hypothetical protein